MLGLGVVLSGEGMGNGWKRGRGSEGWYKRLFMSLKAALFSRMSSGNENEGQNQTHISHAFLLRIGLDIR